MKKYLLKIHCTGKNPCYAYRTVEAENAAKAISHLNSHFNEIGKRETCQIIAVYELLWHIDPDKM